MTPEQLEFINTLLVERDMTPLPLVPRPNLTLSEATAEIKRLLLIKVRVADTGIPEGYYAVASITGNNDFDFFRIDRPDKGKWAGYTFVKRVIGGHPDVNVSKVEARKAIAAIRQAGIDESGELYGEKMKACYKCNTSLTKHASTVLKVGRTCAGRVGKGALWDSIQAEFEKEGKNGDEDSAASGRGRRPDPRGADPERKPRAVGRDDPDVPKSRRPSRPRGRARAARAV
jgi:hypothetical protein